MKRIVMFFLIILFLISLQFQVSVPSLDIAPDAVSAATSKPGPATPTTPATPATPATPVTPSPSAGNTTSAPAASWSSVPSIWAAAEISQASSYGLTTADILNQYNKPITRLEFIRLVMKQYYTSGGTAPEPAVSQPFTDIADGSVTDAYTLGIIHGQGGGKFHPDSLLTRQEAAVMMFREWKLMNGSGVDPVIYPSVFSDSDHISDWALDSIRYMKQIGVLKGSSDGAIDPTGNATREQAILLVLRSFEHQSSKDDTTSMTDKNTDSTSSATTSNDGSGDGDGDGNDED